MRFNLKNGLASQKKLSAPAVDFPRVNESYTGRYVSHTNYIHHFARINSISLINLTFHKLSLQNQETTFCIWNHTGQHCKSYRDCEVWPACWTRDWKDKSWGWRKCSRHLWPGTWTIWFRGCICSSCARSYFWRRWWLLNTLCTWWEIWVLITLVFRTITYHSLYMRQNAICFLFFAMQKISSSCDQCKNNVGWSCCSCWFAP